LGVAFDGDADRAVFVDETGAIRDGDYILALCSVGSRRLVSTVMANFGLERFLKERGIDLIRASVGDRFVAEEMLRTGATLGGEPSGHILFFDGATTGDGLLTAVRLLDILRTRRQNLSELCRELKKCPQVLINVAVREKPPLHKVSPVRRALSAAERRLRNRGRVVLRYSGTEALCRVMVEGFDEAAVSSEAHTLASVVEKALGR
jgi:phosphoglucosamine mutase